MASTSLPLLEKEINKEIRNKIDTGKANDKLFLKLFKSFVSEMGRQQVECDEKNHGLRYALGSLMMDWDRRNLMIPFAKYTKDFGLLNENYSKFISNKEKIKIEVFQEFINEKAASFDSLKDDRKIRVLDCLREIAQEENGKRVTSDESKKQRCLVTLILFNDPKKEVVYMKDGNKLPQYTMACGDISSLRTVLYGNMINQMGVSRGTFDIDDFKYVVLGGPYEGKEQIVCGWLVETARQAKELKDEGFMPRNFSEASKTTEHFGIIQKLAKAAIGVYFYF